VPAIEEQPPMQSTPIITAPVSMGAEDFDDLD
jgi:hypothetical protein